MELGVALGFSMGGAARWRLLSAFWNRLQDVLFPLLLHPLHFLDFGQPVPL